MKKINNIVISDKQPSTNSIWLQNGTLKYWDNSWKEISGNNNIDTPFYYDVFKSTLLEIEDINSDINAKFTEYITNAYKDVVTEEQLNQILNDCVYIPISVTDYTCCYKPSTDYLYIPKDDDVVMVDFGRLIPSRSSIVSKLVDSVFNDYMQSTFKFIYTRINDYSSEHSVSYEEIDAIALQLYCTFTKKDDGSFNAQYGTTDDSRTKFLNGWLSNELVNAVEGTDDTFYLHPIKVFHTYSYKNFSNNIVLDGVLCIERENGKETIYFTVDNLPYPIDMGSKNYKWSMAKRYFALNKNIVNGKWDGTFLINSSQTIING